MAAETGLRAILKPELDERSVREQMDKLEREMDEATKTEAEVDSSGLRNQAMSAVGGAAERYGPRMMPGPTRLYRRGIRKLRGGQEDGQEDGQGQDGPRDEGATDVESGKSIVDLAIDRNDLLEEIKELLDNDYVGSGSDTDYRGRKPRGRGGGLAGGAAAGVGAGALLLALGLSKAGEGAVNIGEKVTEWGTDIGSTALERLTEFGWPDLPDFTWPDLPEWTWPEIPAPGWLDELTDDGSPEEEPSSDGEPQPEPDGDTSPDGEPGDEPEDDPRLPPMPPSVPDEDPEPSPDEEPDIPPVPPGIPTGPENPFNDDGSYGDDPQPAVEPEPEPESDPEPSPDPTIPGVIAERYLSMNEDNEQFDPWSAAAAAGAAGGSYAIGQGLASSGAAAGGTASSGSGIAPPTISVGIADRLGIFEDLMEEATGGSSSNRAMMNEQNVQTESGTMSEATESQSNQPGNTESQNNGGGDTNINVRMNDSYNLDVARLTQELERAKSEAVEKAKREIRREMSVGSLEAR